MGLFLDRWLLALSFAFALPESTDVTINPARTGTLTAFSFGGALSAGRCFGSRWLVCPAITAGLRALAVSASGALYRPGSFLSAIPTLGLDVGLHYRLLDSLWLSAFLRPFAPLGVLTASVEGTSAGFSTAPLEGWFGVGMRWVPGAHFD